MGERRTADVVDPDPLRPTRRSLRRKPTDQVEPQLPVVVRPAWHLVALLVVVAVAPSARGRGNLLLAGLLEGPGSRLAVLAYVYTGSVLLVAARFAVTRIVLRAGEDGRLVVDHRGFRSRRHYQLGRGDAVRLVAGPLRRTVLLDAEGRVTIVGGFGSFWRRPDVVALLRGAGRSRGPEAVTRPTS